MSLSHISITKISTAKNTWRMLAPFLPEGYTLYSYSIIDSTFDRQFVIDIMTKLSTDGKIHVHTFRGEDAMAIGALGSAISNGIFVCLA